MTDKPVDKSKLDARTNAFMEFFETEFGVTFIDAGVHIGDKEQLIKEKDDEG